MDACTCSRLVCIRDISARVLLSIITRFQVPSRLTISAKLHLLIPDVCFLTAFSLFAPVPFHGFTAWI
jgi:hypothetical protein